MAKRVKRNSVKVAPERKVKNGIFSKINLMESYTSLVLGVIVVVIIGILFLSFARRDRSMQTSSIMDVEKIGEQGNSDSNTSSTYTIRPGDDLWTISETIFNNGYKWIEIAKLNKLENPELIYSGDKLMVPSSAQEEQLAVNTEITPESQNNVINNTSITGETYIVKSGDNLWDIAVRAYGDGYKWPEIAKANNLENPDLIYPEDFLKIPK